MTTMTVPMTSTRRDQCIVCSTGPDRSDAELPLAIHPGCEHTDGGLCDACDAAVLAGQVAP